MLLHATCIAIHQHGVLIEGPSGSGKSDLALRLIDQGAELVADDQVIVQATGGELIATPPDQLAGLFEIRQLGILRWPYRPMIALVLAVRLTQDETLPRLPLPDTISLLDLPLRRITLPAYHASTPAKVRAALLHPTVTDSR